MRNKLVLLAIATIMPLTVWAQFDFGGGASSAPAKAWEEFKLNTKSRVKLSFPNSNIDGVLQFFEESTGITIVKDPGLTGKISVTSAKPVSLNDAFQILSTTLTLKGYDLSKEGNLIVIKQKSAKPNTPSFDFSSLGGSGRGENSDVELQVYPIQYANAAQLARVVNDVFAPTSTGATPNFGNFGGGGGGGGRFGRGGGGRFGGGNAGGGNAGGAAGAVDPTAIAAAFAGRTQQPPQVKASSDDFSNSVIVNAPPAVQKQISDLIKKLDKETDQPQQSKVFKLLYASATDLAPVVQNVLVSNAPRGKGGIGQSNVSVQDRFQQALRFGSTQASFGQVAPDTRTNSLVVTATDENLVLIAKVIKDLDTPVDYQTSTFVFPLENARASDVATLLQQAFGTRQGAGVTGAPRTATTNNFNNNNNNNNRSARPTTLGGQLLPANSAVAENQIPTDGTLPVALQDPNATSGELLTEIGTQGFGGFGGGGGGQFRGLFGGSNNQSSSGPTARDANGKLVNVHDLTGQVTAIPDPNTNSIIVVTSPDNAAIIKSVLSQLDHIPEQVVIQTIIVEANLDASEKLGVEWTNAAGKLFGANGSTGTGVTDFGNQTTPPQQGLRYTIASSNLNVFLNAIKTDTKFQILSTPRIFTSNNVQAQINISQSVPYLQSTLLNTNGTQTYNYQFLNVGIVLTVTPHITSNGYVSMEVTQTANDLQGYTNFNAPIVNQREADTTVTVKNGDTVILGGIIRSTVTATTNKVPILGDLPFLGNLFQSKSKDKQKTELLIFMTPSIVRDANDAKKIREGSVQELSPQTRDLLKEDPALLKSLPSVAKPIKKG